MSGKKPMPCETKYCTNKKAKGNNFCHRCIMAKWRANNVMKASYNALKDNATRRKKEFTLTFDEFKEFCQATKYIAGKGKSKDSFSIDRYENDKGYTADNIRVMTLSQNASKGTRVLMYDWHTKYARVI